MTALRKYRESLELTQQKLAELVGVSQPTIALWESGDRKPDIVTLKRLTEILHCTADELLEPIAT